MLADINMISLKGTEGFTLSRHAAYFLRVCTIVLALSSLPVADGLHHMKRIPPRIINRRKDPNTPLIVTNYCPETIYPGITTQSGQGPPQTGFKLDSGDSNSQTVSEDWQGRVWGRTNCSFNSDGTGPGNNGGGNACGTGDCNGTLNCVVTVEMSVYNFQHSWF